MKVETPDKSYGDTLGTTPLECLLNSLDITPSPLALAPTQFLYRYLWFF